MNWRILWTSQALFEKNDWKYDRACCDPECPNPKGYKNIKYLAKPKEIKRRDN